MFVKLGVLLICVWCASLFTIEQIVSGFSTIFIYLFTVVLLILTIVICSCLITMWANFNFTILFTPHFQPAKYQTCKANQYQGCDEAAWNKTWDPPKINSELDFGDIRKCALLWGYLSLPFLLFHQHVVLLRLAEVWLIHIRGRLQSF